MHRTRIGTLRAILFAGALAMSAFVVVAPAYAQTNDGVCEGLDSGKIDVSDPPSVTVTAPDGMLIDGYCVKAGSIHQGFGPVYVEVDPPQKTVTFSYPGKDSISHYSVSYTPEGGGEEECPEGTVLNPDTQECEEPEPDTFAICHAQDDGTWVLLEDLTEAEYEAHANHALDEDPVDGECPEVLPDRVDRPTTDDPDDPGDEVLPDRTERPGVRGQALPFTGLDPAPFLALAGLLAASGASALVISRSKR